jgi:hypothetical protein
MQFIPGSFGNSPEEQERLRKTLQSYYEYVAKEMEETAKFIIASNLHLEKMEEEKRNPPGLSED